MRDTVQKMKVVSQKIQDDTEPLKELTFIVNNEGSVLKGIVEFVSIELSKDVLSQSKQLFAIKTDTESRFNDAEKRFTMFNG